MLSSALLLHGVGVCDRGDFVRRRAPVSLDLDSKLCHCDTKELEQSGLVAVEGAAFLADLVVAVEDDAALVEFCGHAPFPDRHLETVGQGHVVVGGQVSAARVDDAGGDGEVPGGEDAGARVVDFGVILKVLEHVVWFAVGEQQADAAFDVGRQF